MPPQDFLNTSHQRVQWFIDQDRADNLVLRPPFQRRPVWTDDQKSFLVDTVLRGFPVPEVYVFESTDADTGSTTVSIVDGQQRLRALLEFAADGYPVNFDVSKLTPLYTLDDTPWFNLRFSELSPEEKAKFRNYKLIVRDLQVIDEPELRHLFQRLNQSNVALNAQELRFSMFAGPFLDVVERLTNRPEWDHFRVFTPHNRRRMMDSEFVSELIIGYLHWPQNKKSELDHYYRQYSNAFPFDDVEARFAEVLTVLRATFPEPKMSGSRWYRKSDFYTLFLAIARGRLKAGSTDQLRDALLEFGRLVDGEAPSSPVRDYVEAVTRAASDRSRRVQRENALADFVEQKLSSTTPVLSLVQIEQLTPEPTDDSGVGDDDESDDEGSDEDEIV